MGGGHGRRPHPEAAVQQHGRQRQTLRHGGAGPVQPEKGHVLSPDGKAGADALIEQVPCQQIVQGGHADAGLVQGSGQSQLLHGALRLLPAPLPEGVVLADVVKGGGQGTLPLLLTNHAGAADHRGRMLQDRGMAAQLFVCHKLTSSSAGRNGYRPPVRYYFERKAGKI